MLAIKMDDGSMHKFLEYTDYDITENFIVVRDGTSWIGVFDRKHFVSLIVAD